MYKKTAKITKTKNQMENQMGSNLDFETKETKWGQILTSKPKKPNGVKS